MCAQEIELTGVIQDSLHTPVAFATILASSDSNEEKLLAYTTSKDNGSYDLRVKSTTVLDSIWLTYRHMQYATKTIRVPFKSQTVNVPLKAQPNKLDDIIIKAKKNIEIKGDTIVYKVEGLQKENDYTIEEVIDRIPGVTIAENGQISYQGKAISHLYINGVDLLEGRYNIATRGIPAGAVEDIEVLTKHNHARVDIGRTDSDEVAFNLNIKKDRSLVFGSARGDIGVPFVTGKAEITPIYLKEKFQDIASFKANNFGKSLESNGTSLTTGNIDLSTLKLQELDIIYKPNMQGSVISNKYWLDNESTSITNDALYKTQNEVLFKVGLNHNYNFNEIERNENSAYYFDNDSIIVNRKSNNALYERNYYAGVVAEVNKDHIFLKNKTIINGNNSSGNSSIIQNEDILDANYDANNILFSNQLEFKTTINDKIVNNGLIVEYEDKNEDLTVLPAVYEDVIPVAFNPTQTHQDNQFQRFNLGGFTSFDFDLWKAKWQFKQSVNWRNESLQSFLRQEIASDRTVNDFPFTSDFNLKTLETVSSLNSTLKWKRFKLSLTPSLTYLNLNKTERLIEGTNFKSDYLFFQPNANLGYKFNQNWYSSLGFYRSITTSRFNTLFNGLQLRSFAGLSRNPDAVNVNRGNAINHFISYNSILKGLLLSNSFKWNEQQSDFTFSSFIDENGLINTEAIDRPNRASGWSNTFSMNKSFFRILKTDLSYTYSSNKSEQFFNNTAQENINNAHFTRLELSLDNNTWYGVSYDGIFNFGLSRINDFKTDNTFIKHNVELDFYLSSKTRWNLGVESVVSTFSNSENVNKNTLFNTSFFYKPSKKLFLRASLINIFNEDFFTTSSSSANYINQSQFSLRPRQFTIGLNYSL